MPRVRIGRCPTQRVASFSSGTRCATTGENSIVALPRHRAEADLAVLLADVGERRDPVQVDERGGPRQAEVQQRHQALAAGQHLGVAAVAAQRRERLVEARGRVVLELGRFHCSEVLEVGSDRGWPEIGASGSDTPVLTVGAPAPMWLRHARSHRWRPGSGLATCLILQSFEGVMGSALILTPSGASASLTAFAMTAGTVIDEDSPSPFEPSGVSGDGETTCAISICGASLAVGTR